MAYKFQRGEAILSGALLQEGSIEIESGFEFSMHDETVLDTSRNLTVAGMSGSGDLQAGGAMTIAGNSDLNGTLDVAGDTKLAASGVGTQIRGDLTVDELADFNGGATFNTAIVEDLTDGRIVLAGTGGELEDSANLAFDGSQLSVTGVISGSSDLEIGGTVRLDGVVDEALDVGAHSFYYRDSSGGVKRDTMSDYADAIAGDGLAAASGVLAVQVDDSGIEINSDVLRLKDSGVLTAKIADDAVTPAKMSLFDDALAATDTHILIADGTDYSSFAMSGDATLSNAGVLTIAANAVEDSMVNDNVATGLAGDGLGASSGVLAVQVSGAIAIHSDYVGLSGSVAGDGLAFAGGADSISALSLDLSEYSTVQVASGDKFLMLDSDGATEQMETVDSLSEFQAGAGLTATAGVLAVVNATNGGLFVDADAISLSLDDLAAADIDVANDSIAYYDDSESGTRKESIADLVSAMAGEGLTATNGVLKVTGNDVHLKADGDTLQEGYNYFADAASSLSASLPAAATPGDVVHVKAGDLGEDVTLKVMPYAAQTIDGDEGDIYLESPYAAVSLVYVVSGSWRIV
jgi:hypothetical protein